MRPHRTPPSLLPAEPYWQALPGSRALLQARMSRATELRLPPESLRGVAIFGLACGRRFATFAS